MREFSNDVVVDATYGSPAHDLIFGWRLCFLGAAFKRPNVEMHTDWIPQGVRFRLRGVDVAEANRICEAWLSQGGSADPFIVAIRELPAEPFPAQLPADLAPGSAFGLKLTKALVMNLRAGSRIFSNCIGSLDLVLGPRETRESSWALAKSNGANGRLCYILPPPKLAQAENNQPGEAR